MYECLKSFLIREILDFLHKAVHARTIDLSDSGNLSVIFLWEAAILEYVTFCF